MIGDFYIILREFSLSCKTIFFASTMSLSSWFSLPNSVLVCSSHLLLSLLLPPYPPFLTFFSPFLFLFLPPSTFKDYFTFNVVCMCVCVHSHIGTHTHTECIWVYKCPWRKEILDTLEWKAIMNHHVRAGNSSWDMHKCKKSP